MTATGRKLSKQDVLNILRDRILYLELPPGTPISDMELARELEVSRTPVREALILLNQEHLVNIYPQSGTFVAPLDLELIREIVYIRHVVECDVLLRLAEQRVTMTREILHSIRLQKLAVQENDQKEYVKNDHEFHRQLFAMGGHGRSWELIRAQYMHTTRFHMLDFQHSNTVFNTSLNEHLEIIACLESGNRPELLRLLTIHHDCDLQTAQELQSAYPQYFR